MNPALRQF
jgi:biopolymer transport protein ExbB